MTIIECNFNNIDLLCYEPNSCKSIYFNNKDYTDAKAINEFKRCNTKESKNQNLLSIYIIVGESIFIIIGTFIIFMLNKKRKSEKKNKYIIDLLLNNNNEERNVNIGNNHNNNNNNNNN